MKVIRQDVADLIRRLGSAERNATEQAEMDENALVELAEMIAAQDDALVELAELITEG